MPPDELAKLTPEQLTAYLYLGYLRKGDFTVTRTNVGEHRQLPKENAIDRIRTSHSFLPCDR
jgi:hypothetical protein